MTFQFRVRTIFTKTIRCHIFPWINVVIWLLNHGGDIKSKDRKMAHRLTSETLVLIYKPYTTFFHNPWNTDVSRIAKNIFSIRDFNVKLSIWNSQDRGVFRTQSNINNRAFWRKQWTAKIFEGTAIENMTPQFGLHQVIKELTHICDTSSSCIKLIFTS